MGLFKRGHGAPEVVACRYGEELGIRAAEIARAEVGANHQPFIRGGAIERGRGASLCRFQSGNLGADPSYAYLLAKEGITVNAIAPALIHTEMVANSPKAQPSLIPVGRFGTVEEVATVEVLLAGNGYITGQTINVNRGWYMS